MRDVRSHVEEFCGSLGLCPESKKIDRRRTAAALAMQSEIARLIAQRFDEGASDPTRVFALLAEKDGLEQVIAGGEALPHRVQYLCENGLWALFEFVSKDGFEPHWHNRFCVLLVVRGLILVTLTRNEASRQEAIGEGQFIFIPPGIGHAIECISTQGAALISIFARPLNSLPVNGWPVPIDAPKAASGMPFGDVFTDTFYDEPRSKAPNPESEIFLAAPCTEPRVLRVEETISDPGDRASGIDVDFVSDYSIFTKALLNEQGVNRDAMRQKDFVPESPFDIEALLSGVIEEAQREGESIKAGALVTAREALGHLADLGVGAPDVYPSDNAGVALDYLDAKKPEGVLIICDPDGSVSVFIDDSTRSDRARFSSFELAQDLVERAVLELSGRR